MTYVMTYSPYQASQQGLSSLRYRLMDAQQQRRILLKYQDFKKKTILPKDILKINRVITRCKDNLEFMSRQMNQQVLEGLRGVY